MSLIIDSINSHSADSVALIGDNYSLTYDELSKEIDKKAKELKNCKALGIALPNGIDWILWDLAAIKSEVISVPIPVFFTKEQQEHLLKTAGISHVISEGGLYETGATPSNIIPKGTAKITFTSGSTGEPKGVCLSQSGIEEVCKSIIKILGSRYAQEHMSVLPLSVLLENVAGVYSSLIIGSKCHIYSSKKTGMSGSSLPDISQMIKIINEKKITSIILVPEVLKGLMAFIEETGVRLISLKFIAVGGARIDPELLKRANDIGLPVYEGYGLSECASVVSLNIPNCNKKGTSGKILPHIKVEVKDKEIIISNSAFLGYLESPHSGSYNTGDLGTIDENGFISISGRKKNLLITSYGRNISPEWVESILLAEPEIFQAFVYGDAEPYISALIVPVSVDVNVKKIIDRVNKKLPDYARVGKFHKVAFFSILDGTLSGVGRLKRNVILKKYENLIRCKEITDLNERLDYETAVHRMALYSVPQIVEAMQGKLTFKTYLTFLEQTYHYVKHMVPLLIAMKEGVRKKDSWIIPYIDKYIKEETGEENWILENITAMGGDENKIKISKPLESVELFNSYNYDCVRSSNPLSFLGVIFMLENASKNLAAEGTKAIKNSLGVKDSGITYLEAHTKIEKNLEEQFLYKTFKAIHKKPDQDFIIETAQKGFLLFADIMRSIPNAPEKVNIEVNNG